PPVPVKDNNTTFSLILIPDMQYALTQEPGAFNAMTKWIVDNAASDKEDIRFVLQEGDVQEYPVSGNGTIKFYPLAQTAMSALDGRVPYVVAIGNHDFDAWSGFVEGSTVQNPKFGAAAISKDRSTTLFNRYFPITKFNSWPSFGSSYPTGTNDNSFHKFSAGGTDWGILTLKFAPTQDEIDWGSNIIASNPKLRFIILTHSYLNGSGERFENGKDIWEGVAKLHANVSFVFSGHIPAVYDSQHTVENGIKGNLICQILFDYQNPNKLDPNTYFMRINFNTAENKVQFRSYSPYLDRFAPKDNANDDSDDFTITTVPLGKL
ncbi:MAG: hypothetical protein EOO20_28305, partial [Chryseobacterium sp.]